MNLEVDSDYYVSSYILTYFTVSCCYLTNPINITLIHKSRDPDSYRFRAIYFSININRRAYLGAEFKISF